MGGVEWGFMVCMALRRSPRILIQKTDLRDFFRRTNPATRKSSPNLLGAYMRRAGEPNGKPTQLITTASAAAISILTALAATLSGFHAFGYVFWAVTA